MATDCSNKMPFNIPAEVIEVDYLNIENYQCLTGNKYSFGNSAINNPLLYTLATVLVLRNSPCIALSVVLNLRYIPTL